MIKQARMSGCIVNTSGLGGQQRVDQVQKGDALATIGSPFGKVFDTVCASCSGIIIGKQNIPLVQEGDAMFHIAYFAEQEQEIAENIEIMQDTLLM